MEICIYESFSARCWRKTQWRMVAHTTKRIWYVLIHHFKMMICYKYLLQVYRCKSSPYFPFHHLLWCDGMNDSNRTRREREKVTNFVCKPILQKFLLFVIVCCRWDRNASTNTNSEKEEKCVHCTMTK